VEEGGLGFGVINPDSTDTMVFLYGPGVHLQPAGIKETKSAPIILRNSYAFGKDKKTLTKGDTIVLASYRESGVWILMMPNL
jgi:hypothetical protein